MFKFLDNVSYQMLGVITLFMLLAPFTPQPHLLEKWEMFKAGTLNKPIDIFDVFYHLIPLILLIIKAVKDQIAN